MKLKSTIEIPKGWRRLRTGGRVRAGDRYVLLQDTFLEGARWIYLTKIDAVEWPVVRSDEIVIRKWRKA